MGNDKDNLALGINESRSKQAVEMIKKIVQEYGDEWNMKSSLRPRILAMTKAQGKTVLACDRTFETFLRRRF
jgi:predicted DNA-binding ribbon-helix-helix protein